MLMTIRAGELRRALADIEAAERNGFMHCEAVVEAESAIGGTILLRYSDLWEKAHPTDGSLNWGRFQGVSARHRFDGVALVPLGDAKAEGR